MDGLENVKDKWIAPDNQMAILFLQKKVYTLKTSAFYNGFGRIGSGSKLLGHCFLHDFLTIVKRNSKS